MEKKRRPNLTLPTIVAQNKQDAMMMNTIGPKKLQFGDCCRLSTMSIRPGSYCLPLKRRVPAMNMFVKKAISRTKLKIPKRRFRVYLQGSTFLLYWAIIYNFLNSFSTIMQFTSNSCCSEFYALILPYFAILVHDPPSSNS